MHISAAQKRFVDQYYKELAAYKEQDVSHETAVRSAFQNLLANFAPAVNWMLIPEETLANGKRPDGTYQRGTRQKSPVRSGLLLLSLAVLHIARPQYQPRDRQRDAGATPADRTPFPHHLQQPRFHAPQSPARTLSYYRVPEFWRKTEKLTFLTNSKSISGIDWQELQPDEKYTWLTENLQYDASSRQVPTYFSYA